MNGQLTYTVHSTITGQGEHIKEELTRETMIETINIVKTRHCPQSNCIFHLNGDITIDMKGSVSTINGYFKLD